jgi:Amt family ammonium transporter
MGFRVTKDVEEAGVDLVIHAETAYSSSSTGGGFHPLGVRHTVETLLKEHLEKHRETPREEVLAGATRAGSVGP